MQSIRIFLLGLAVAALVAGSNIGCSQESLTATDGPVEKPSTAPKGPGNGSMETTITVTVDTDTGQVSVDQSPDPAPGDTFVFEVVATGSGAASVDAYFTPAGGQNEPTESVVIIDW